MTPTNDRSENILRLLDYLKANAVAEEDTGTCGRYLPDEVLQSYPPYVRNGLTKLANGRPIIQERKGWLPFCTVHETGEGHHPSLSVSIGEGGKILLCCRSRGCAAEKIVQAVGMTMRDLWCPPGEQPMRPLANQPDAEPLDPVECDRVYRAALKVLPELSAEDGAWMLRKYGVTHAEAIALGCRSVPENMSEEHLCSLVRDELKGKLPFRVPGFCIKTSKVKWDWFESKTKRLALAIDPRGIVIPLRDEMDRIIGLKTRRRGVETGRKRWCAWSSGGRPRGANAGYLYHVARPAGEHPSDVAWLTEGEMKANAIALRKGQLAVSAPGVDTWEYTLPALKQLGVQRVIVGFDFGDMAKIRRTTTDCIKALGRAGYKVSLAHWETNDA